MTTWLLDQQLKSRHVCSRPPCLPPAYASGYRHLQSLDRIRRLQNLDFRERPCRWNRYTSSANADLDDSLPLYPTPYLGRVLSEFNPHVHVIQARACPNGICMFASSESKLFPADHADSIETLRRCLTLQHQRPLLERGLYTLMTQVEVTLGSHLSLMAMPEWRLYAEAVLCTGNTHSLYHPNRLLSPDGYW